MPTNPIPAGSCNLPVNMPRIARDAIGRLAYANDRYVGEFIRGLLVDRLSAAGESGEIPAELAFDAVEALQSGGRRAVRALANGAKVSCFVAVCFLSVLGGVPRGSRRATRRPTASVVRLVSRAARKVGEWEVTPV